MSKLLLVLAVGTVWLGVLKLRGARPTRRALHELGQLALPRRLEPLPPDERATFALFAFDRTSGSVLHMGSNRPVAEKLVVGAWTPASRQEAHDATVDAARDRTRDIAWRADGEVLVGEGTHAVNTAVHPAWVLARDDAARGLTVAYMVWKRDASLARARATFDAALRSFEPGLPAAAYLAVARERPARERAARLAALEAALAARGVRVTPGGPPVEHEGRWYAFAHDARDGDSFTLLVPIGTLPVAARYRERETQRARPESWLDAVWFAPSVADSAHEVPGRGAPYLPPALVRAVTAHLAARDAGGAPRAHFFAGQTMWLDGSDGRRPDLAAVERAASSLAARFAAGRLLETMP